MTGAGEKFFSAGWDLKAAAEGEHGRRLWPGGSSRINRNFQSRQTKLSQL
ncbi:hypothetical protein ACVXHB_22890 [Escherichia coli]